MKPAVVHTVAQARHAILQARAQNLTVGLVPTMGALHAGHASLIQTAQAETGFVVVSIFVNPTQFGPREDLSRYPRPLEHDLEMCAAEGVALVFHPEPAEMYSANYQTYVEVHELQDSLCGASRPGHFRGVATVVLKLFNIVQPDVAYFGQKDAQQSCLIRRLVRDLNVPVAIRVCPTLREADGLALSSRNVYLSAEERKHATVLYECLREIQRRVASGERSRAALLQPAQARIAGTPGVRLDYLDIVNPETLAPLDTVAGNALIAVAAYVGTTRLIDNLMLS